MDSSTNKEMKVKMLCFKFNIAYTNTIIEGSSAYYSITSTWRKLNDDFYKEHSVYIPTEISEKIGFIRQSRMIITEKLTIVEGMNTCCLPEDEFKEYVKDMCLKLKTQLQVSKVILLDFFHQDSNIHII